MENQVEVWKPVKGYEECYAVSSWGRVKRLPRVYTDSMGRTSKLGERIVVGKVGATGYKHIVLCKPNTKQITKDFHRLIAEAFIPNPDNLPCINHKNENRSDNRVENLEWCSYRYNNMYNNAVKRREKTRKNKRKVCQYTLQGELVHTYTNMKEVKQTIGMSVYPCVNGYQKQAKGYVWKYEGEPFEYTKKERDTSTECHNFDKTAFSGFHKGDNKTTFVEQYSLDGQFVSTYTSATKAAKAVGAHISNLVACCQGRQASCKGFHWKYKY